MNGTKADQPPENQPKLLDRVRSALRVKHYSLRTEETYVDWAKRFILFHGKRHPNEMGEEEVAAFLTHLAEDRHVSASTQNQAFSAILFLYYDRHLRRIMGDLMYGAGLRLMECVRLRVKDGLGL